jgi:hypothetical protein
MALPVGVKIAGVVRIDVDQGEPGREGHLYVEMVGTDGLTYRTHWLQSDLARFVGRVEDAPQRAPLGAVLQ